jgi:hypothetical protein
MIDAQRVRREAVRWHIILTLNNARPIGAYAESVLPVVQAIYPDSTDHELRQELEYLAEGGHVHVEVSPNGRWHARLTRHGINMAEYTAEDEPGIGRPKKYW